MQSCLVYCLCFARFGGCITMHNTMCAKYLFAVPGFRKGEFVGAVEDI